MILYPAIDIRGGRAVRLLRGDYERETRYDADPLDAARRWVESGAEILHVVDLDGAREGAPRNLETIRRLAAAVDVPLQVGGGLRRDEDLGAALEAGAERVVLGTAAICDPNLLDRALDRHGERVVVSVDAKGGRVALEGWTETGSEDAADVVAALGRRGVATFLCTSIEVDGTMAGPAFAELARLAAATDAAILASGGVGTLADLEALAAAAAPNVSGAIVGRALYERRFTVAEAIAALES